MIGKPSPTLLARMTEKEAQRIEHQRGLLGERGLLQRGQALDRAVEANEVGPSQGLENPASLKRVGPQQARGKERRIAASSWTSWRRTKWGRGEGCANAPFPASSAA